MIAPIDALIGDATPTPSAPSIQPSGFGSKISFGILYHQMLTNIQHLHASNQDVRAREVFYNSIANFAGIWDERFVADFKRIRDMFPDDHRNRYILHTHSFARMIQRAGVAAKPDTRQSNAPAWDAPSTLTEADSTPVEEV